MNDKVTVEVGDRVQIRSRSLPVAYATWGTVEANLGLGRVRVRLDDGWVSPFWMKDLQFAKCGRQALERIEQGFEKE
jgi:hypothetical protein